jgi:mRNA interferase MazF
MTFLNLSKEKILKTGELYWVNLAPTMGDEIRKTRPVIVLNGGHEKHLKLAIVVPITAWSPHWEENPFFVTLMPGANNGLQKKSAVDCFQVRALSHKRFVNRIGNITTAEIDAIKKAIALILDIEPEHCD